MKLLFLLFKCVLNFIVVFFPGCFLQRQQYFGLLQHHAKHGGELVSQGKRWQEEIILYFGLFYINRLNLDVSDLKLQSAQ
jgi:hypothetical protein